MQDLPDRFLDKVHHEPNSGCWLWVGAQTAAGYGLFHFDNKLRYAHRVSYTIHKGEIPSNLEIDHLCRVTCCVNPIHLEAVTRMENIRRSPFHRRKTHCFRGHPYDEKNTYISKRGGRHCKECNRIRNLGFMRKKRALEKSSGKKTDE